MNKKLLFPLVFAFALLTINKGYTQSKNKKDISKSVKYTENVNAPLTSHEMKMLKEVYLDQLQERVLNNPNKVKRIKHLLRNRVEIQERPKLVKHTSKYTLLSKAGLYNTYNKELKMDVNYNPKTFNVLKYNLQFFGVGASIYRIDNTNYFIIIKSQHQ